MSTIGDASQLVDRFLHAAVPASQAVSWLSSQVMCTCLLQVAIDEGFLVALWSNQTKRPSTIIKYLENSNISVFFCLICGSKQFHLHFGLRGKLASISFMLESVIIDFTCPTSPDTS